MSDDTTTTTEATIDRLTAERDWYRAGLHGISKGHYADPAEHAAGVLKWVGDDTPNPVDRLREANAALVTAATYAAECWGEPEQDWCRSDMEGAMKEVRAGGIGERTSARLYNVVGIQKTAL